MDQKKNQQAHQEDPKDMVWYDKYSFFSRIYNYEFVHNTLSYGKSVYDYIKGSNSYIKSTLELGEGIAVRVECKILNTLENYDNIVKRFDDMGNNILDNIENKVDDYSKIGQSLTKKLDVKINNLISTTSNYTPNSVIGIAKKTSDSINDLVDSALPPPQGENLDKLNQDEIYELEKRMEFLLKLRKRLNVPSAVHIPINLYNSISGHDLKSKVKQSLPNKNQSQSQNDNENENENQNQKDENQNQKYENQNQNNENQNQNQNEIDGSTTSNDHQNKSKLNKKQQKIENQKQRQQMEQEIDKQCSEIENVHS